MYRDKYYTLNKTYIAKVRKFCASMGIHGGTKYKETRIKGINGILTNIVQHDVVKRTYPKNSGMGDVIDLLVRHGYAIIKIMPSDTIHPYCKIFRTQKLIDVLGDVAIAREEGITPGEVAATRTVGTIRCK